MGNTYVGNKPASGGCAIFCLTNSISADQNNSVSQHIMERTYLTPNQQYVQQPKQQSRNLNIPEPLLETVVSSLQKTARPGPWHWHGHRLLARHIPQERAKQLRRPTPQEQARKAYSPGTGQRGLFPRNGPER